MAKIDKIQAYIEKVIQEPLEDIVSKRFASYSKYIIQDRALPDARDGLKPVQRRILYAMNELGMQYNKPHKKSARIAGEVMGKYHPHGDSSIYEAMVRLSQDFKMLVPLIDMHGNNGSIDGDSAAAMRYTEARLSRAAEYLLKDIEKRTVPFVPNFDDEEVEPVVLPAKFPNLLVNGAAGISAGYATKIPPHNLKEIIDATIYYIDHENMSVYDLQRFVQGPDFPTGGVAQGSGGILSAFETGAGKIVLRAKTSVEEISKSQDRILIHEIPYEVNKSELVRSIDMLRIEKKVEDILEVRDETDQEGLRIAIDLKKGADVQTILAYLFKNTNLQVIFNYNLVSILNNRPVLSGFLPVLKAYIDHQKEVITNRSNFELDKAKKRQHIVEGLIHMVSVVEEVVAIIRRSNNKQESKVNLQNRFGFSEIQAEAIVTLQLYRLSNTDILALKEEFEHLTKEITRLELILNSEVALRGVIKTELKETSMLLQKPRKTVIESEIETLKIDENKLISEETVMLAVTKDGYLKRSSLRSYQASTSVGLKPDDAIYYQKEVSTLETLLIFTNKGNYIYVPIHKLEDQKWKDLGLYMGNIVDIEKDERVVYALTVLEFNKEDSLLITTETGMMKQIKLSDLEVSRYSKSIRYMKLQENDYVASVDISKKSRIIVASKLGYVLHFDTEELPLYGLSAGGVKSMSLSGEDKVAKAMYAKNDDDILLFTIRGNVIKDSVQEIPLYGRNRRGIRIVALQKGNPHDVVGMIRVAKEHYKENSAVGLIGTKGRQDVNVQDTKYSQNKFGKHLLDDTFGEGYDILIQDVLEKEEETVTKPKKVQSKKEPEKALVMDEVIVTKSSQKIKLSRLDLFDDEL